MIKQKLSSCVKGKLKPLSSVSDPVFSQGMLGEGIAITPSEGVVLAPCDGVISMMFPTYHAFGIHIDGVDVLIHIGIDTVALNGKHFKALVKEGDIVTRHQVCVMFELDKIIEQNIITDTMMVITQKPEHVVLDIHDVPRDTDHDDIVISWK